MPLAAIFKSQYTSRDAIKSNPTDEIYYESVSESAGGAIVIGPVTEELQGVEFGGSFRITIENSYTWQYGIGPNSTYYVDYLEDQYSIWTFKYVGPAD